MTTPPSMASPAPGGEATAYSPSLRGTRWRLGLLSLGWPVRAQRTVRKVAGEIEVQYPISPGKKDARTRAMDRERKVTPPQQRP